MTDKKQKILESVIKILICTLGIKREKITLESNFVDDLGADSLDSVEIIMEVEEKFNISCPDEEAIHIKTVNDLVEYISKNT